MIGWLLSRIKWLGLLAAGAPFLFGPMEYMSATDTNEMRANGVEAVAEIEGGKKTTRRRSGTSFSVNLAWKDKSGKEIKAEGVKIGSSVASRIIRNDMLVEDTIKIRYLPDDPSKAPVIASELGEGGDPIMMALTTAGIFTPTAILGGLLFFFLHRREKRAA